MSLYRAEDIIGHSTGEVKSSSREHQNPTHQEPTSKSESPDVTTHSFSSTAPVRPDYAEEYANKPMPSDYPSHKPPGATSEYPPKPPVEFTPKPMEQPYHSKQLQSDSDRVHPSEVDDNYSKMEPRHAAPGGVPFPGQPRFLPGQGMSQPTGTTPTLNQLLQASSPVHRFHSSYPTIGSEGYQQPWPMQRPIGPPVYPPSQRPPQTGSPSLHHGPGGPGTPPMPYQSYNQRFPSPARPHSPYSHHQLNVPPGHSSNMYGEQRGWNQGASHSPLPPLVNQPNASSQSPQRAMSQSPAPPSASPQPQPPNQQPPPPPQNFHGMQQRSTTPNTQGIDTGELSGQNSNDSSNGPAGPATPNSQSMRPTPSPTGSTGSRSMSPAVVQPSIQMPPRPSSSQSDGGSGPARMSLSPLATQASNEDASFPPKVRKEVMGYHSHPPTPQSTAPSPGAASMNSAHEDYPDINSPSWPRTSASPVYNAHIPQDPYRPKKSDSLAKLYEMDDSAERRAWLDRLVGFMEDRRTPITTCPTISKNPLDLFRLYLSVKERGGFMEVTKNKTWKDVAGLLGIGASSSAAYTLRKHYTKHLLAFECHFDRGGVDPQPIISQFEGSSKKKGAKSTSSVPSPGSSNSQDSFPAGSTNTSIDSYGSYQSNYSSNTTSGGTTVDYNSVPNRPPSQSNPPHQAMQQSNYQNSSVFPNYPQDQYNRPQGGSMPMQNDFAQPFSARPHYSPYGTESERNYPGGNIPANSPGSPDVYNRYGGNQQPGGYSNTTPPSNRAPYAGTPQGHTPNAQQPLPAQNNTPPQATAGGNYSYPQDYYRSEHSNFGPSIGSPVYTNTGAPNKNMPPPPPGAQQPRRHPDFVKEQQYSSYSSQRSVYPGWPAGSNQYSSGGGVRMPYPNQQMQSSPQHQPLPQSPSTPTPPVTAAMGMNNNQQWNNQQNARPPTQANINPPAHPPSPWDNRYQPSSLYAAPGGHQTQLGMNPALNQQPGIKKDMIFPPESVEAITPLLNKRRKLTRSDVSPVEAWRIMMALRSGLLAESCWALDVLNILLFDDASVQYFGLTHLPGLLDVLLEHFSRSLADMFDSSSDEDDHGFYKKSIRHPEIDLGAITKPIDSEDRIKLLTTLNYTLQSRRGKPVKVVPRDDDIFILDNRRSWDAQDFESDVQPWQYEESTISYIIKCFESEINSVSVTKDVKDEKLKNSLPEESTESADSENKTDSCDKKPNIVVENKVEECDSIEETNIKVTKNQQERKKKTKSLSDVLSRIKKEPVEINDLTRELFVKKNDGSNKKESENDSKNIANSVDSCDTEVTESNKTSTKQQNGLSDFSNKLTSQVADEKPEKEKIESESQDKTENNKEPEKIEETPSKEEDNGDSPSEEKIIPKLNIRDPAGTLKRRRASDYEDENYSRDEASLYLVTETQDNLARRCVCLSTILRNLTFIPGNEMEFARNVTFLSLMGKLLLLHHDHPTRAQKTRNYDREEDADFADSCSSLQGENEWWWDFLYYIRENILVMAANISGHMDLSQYPEEISRPVLDGLLHWAVCPAAHGQDPFPTVGINSSLSPQRLALEALCKLCVTENNVDLIVATPPYSRLEKLCSVLSRLLCRSEEQVLREFGVNLLHFLSAADSGVARTIALQTPCVALLVAFIEQAENGAAAVVSQHGIAALRDNPETMGTSLDMLRRAAGTLLNLSRHPDNRTLLLQHESRLLQLVMSQILDQQVAAIVARVLFQCSRGTT